MSSYLSLPSGLGSITYPNNTSGNSNFQLAKEIFLPEGDWEVRLSTTRFQIW